MSRTRRSAIVAKHDTIYADAAVRVRPFDGAKPDTVDTNAGVCTILVDSAKLNKIDGNAATEGYCGRWCRFVSGAKLHTINCNAAIGRDCDCKSRPGGDSRNGEDFGKSHYELSLSDCLVKGDL